MIVSTMVKLKTLGFAHKVVTGAFISGALVGIGLAAGAAALSSANRSGLLCRKTSSKNDADTPSV